MKVSTGQILAFMLGMTATMPIVGISFGAKYISVFNITFILNLLFLFRFWIRKESRHRITVIKEEKTFVLFLLWDVVSVLVGLFVLPQEWDATIVSYLIKTFQFLIFVFLLNQYRGKEKLYQSFFCGFIVGCFGNVFWSILEFLGYKILGIRLNDMIFNGYTKQLSRSTLITTEYGVRTSGFNYDPAHLGGILPIAFGCAMVRRNLCLFVICMVALAFSQSSTAVVGCVIIFIGILVLEDVLPRKNAVKRPQIRRISLLVAYFMIIGFVFIFSKNDSINTIGELIINNVDGFLQRIKEVYLIHGQESLRGIYYKNAFNELLNRGVVSITGTGIGSSGYAYYGYSGVASQGIFDVESVYLSYLFGTGVVGLFLYCYTLFETEKNILQNSRKAGYIEKGYAVALGSLISCGFFYHYTLTAYQVLLIIFAITGLKLNGEIKNGNINTVNYIQR